MTARSRHVRSSFAYDKERNVYLCPGGNLLASTGNIDQGRILYYRALKSDCSACSLKPQIKRTWRGLVSMSANSTEVIRSAAAGPWSLALPSGLALLAFAIGLAEKPPL